MSKCLLELGEEEPSLEFCRLNGWATQLLLIG